MRFCAYKVRKRNNEYSPLWLKKIANMEKKEKLEKAVKLYAGCQLLSGSVHGDHQSADDDDAYAKQYDWGFQDSDENDWDKADEAY